MALSITSASELVEALGGTSAVALLTGRTPQAVTNWRARNSIPAEAFLVLSKAASGVGFEAPPTLFGISVPGDDAPLVHVREEAGQ